MSHRIFAKVICEAMKKLILFLLFLFQYGLLSVQYSFAQCSICTKTAEQLGEGPAQGLNSGILYLMFMPLVIMSYIGFRWWKREKEVMKDERSG